MLTFEVLDSSTRAPRRSRLSTRPLRSMLTGVLLAAALAGCGGDNTPSQAGKPDTSFGAGVADGTPDGAVSASLGAGNDSARAVVVQADGKTIVVGTTVAADGSTNISVARFNADGSPDAAFGVGTSDGTPDGAVGISISSGDDAANGIALQADGKIVVVGTSTAGDKSTNVAVARLNANGSLDASFGAGTVTAADKSTNVAVARLATDGSLDATFGAGTSDGTPDGVVAVSLGNGNDAAVGVALQADGRIVIAGTTTAADGSTNIALARLLGN